MTDATVELDTDDDGRLLLERSKLETMLTDAYRRGFADAQAGAESNDQTVRLVELSE